MSTKETRGKKKSFNVPLNVRITFLVTKEQHKKLQDELEASSITMSLSKYCRIKVLGL